MARKQPKVDDEASTAPGRGMAEPQDAAADDDLGLDDILTQLNATKAQTTTPAVAPAVTPASNRVQVVAKAVPLSDRADLAAAAAGDDAVKALIESALRDFDEVGKEVLDKWRADRGEVQEVIDHLKDAVINQAVVNAHGTVPAVYIESLVKALEVKGNMSLTAVKALDAKTRLLAALKGGVHILNQQNTVVPPGELERVLAEPVDDDFAGTKQV